MGFKSIVLSKENILGGFFLYHLNSSVNSQGVMDSTCVSREGKMGDGCAGGSLYKTALGNNGPPELRMVCSVSPGTVDRGASVACN